MPGLSAKIHLENRIAEIEKCLPATVVAINEDGTLEVEIPINFILADVETGEEVITKRPTYQQVRYGQITSGGFSFNLPVHVGDTGILVGFDRNCRGFFEGGGIDTAPSDLTLHKFTSSFFVPINFFSPAVAQTIKDNLIIYREGDPIFEIDSSTKKIMIHGDLELSGSVKVKGDVNAEGDITAGRTSLKNHTHGYVNYPGSTTIPVPSQTDRPT